MRRGPERGASAPTSLALFVLFLGLLQTTDVRAVEQPVAFKHQIHVTQEEIPCTDCHVGAETSIHASLPPREICEDCHEPGSPLGETPEEAALLDLLSQDTPIAWHRVHKLRDYVNFSHRRHVLAGGVLCETCHGMVGEMEAPFSKPYINFTREFGMERCISCHRNSGNARAGIACELCHK